MKNSFVILVLALVLLSCGNKTKKSSNQIEDGMDESSISNNLKEALTLYASFDTSIDADVANGDAKLYTVMNRREADSAIVGLHKDSVSHSKNLGKTDGALLFSGKTKGSIYYKSRGNIAYDSTNWNGAISFWLKLNPNEDLQPGYCDPIQITDVSYNDASIWVDFTKTLPRAFRLGVIEDRDAWNPEPEGPDNENPKFLDLLVRMDDPPFNRDEWTHVLVNYSGLNSPDGKAELYVNGDFVGVRENISNAFTWNLEESNIYLGLSYIGLFDELSIFNRSLSKEEIEVLYKGKSILK
ncbi:LamG-like jellyroll fold domain-containing protein [Winogradskyella aurantiaca]|uniref:LamG-like jellyroll fold domain-containing protein n=1 Tax=Winogradskyella aurantiaca TaxID=2219558 RepID=UPI000E1E0207|nr:LamG-like jellyroll fold domain-containing protein [Winogradskyella aurantiaca]